MTTVTGFTAARMLAMENATIIDGDVVGNNLILKRKDGTPLNAGSVRGPQGTPGTNGTNGTNGATGATGPAGAPAVPVYANAAARDAAIPSPTPGRACFLTSSGEYQIYQGTAIAGGGNAGWYPPWNTSWGEIKDAYQQLTAPSTPIVGPGNLSGLDFTFKHPFARRILLSVYGQISLDSGGAGEARLTICQDGSAVQFGDAYVPTADRGYALIVQHEYFSDGASHGWNVQIGRTVGSARAYMIASAALKTVFRATDLGLG